MPKLRMSVIAVIATALSFLGIGLVGAAPAMADGASLTPDASAYCMMNLPYDTQVREMDWKVQFSSLDGDAYQNNWRCTYWVAATLPHNDIENNTFYLPPMHQSFPIDWNAMCNQQYPGASASWIPGPETGAYGAPWGCIGAPGVSYNSAENADGTHDVLSGSGW